MLFFLHLGEKFHAVRIAVVSRTADDLADLSKEVFLSCVVECQTGVSMLYELARLFDDAESVSSRIARSFRKSAKR